MGNPGIGLGGTGQQWGMEYSEYDPGGVPVDASDPNTVAPPAARVFRVEPQPGPATVTSAQRFIVFVADGTSLAVEYWILDDSPNAPCTTGGNPRWWRASVQTATSASGSATFQLIPGAKAYLRITANTGTVMNYGIAIV